MEVVDGPCEITSRAPRRRQRRRGPTAPPCAGAAWPTCFVSTLCRRVGQSAAPIRGQVSEPRTPGRDGGESGNLQEPGNLPLAAGLRFVKISAFQFFGRPRTRRTRRAGPARPRTRPTADPEWPRGARSPGVHGGPHGPRPPSCGARVARSDWARASAHRSASEWELRKNTCPRRGRACPGHAMRVPPHPP